MSFRLVNDDTLELTELSPVRLPETSGPSVSRSNLPRWTCDSRRSTSDICDYASECDRTTLTSWTLGHNAYSGRELVYDIRSRSVVIGKTAVAFLTYIHVASALWCCTQMLLIPSGHPNAAYLRSGEWSNSDASAERAKTCGTEQDLTRHIGTEPHRTDGSNRSRTFCIL